MIMKYAIITLSTLNKDYLDDVFTGPDGKDYLIKDGKTYDPIFRILGLVLCKVY